MENKSKNYKNRECPAFGNTLLGAVLLTNLNKMNITLKRNYGFELIIEAENMRVIEDVEERIYGKTDDGKTDYRNVKRDVKTDTIEQFVNVLDDMIYYREAEFDSSGLIERLFEKLPQEAANKLLVKLKRDYEVDVEEAPHKGEEA